MPVLTHSILRERVDRGVALLDVHAPDWRLRVDPLRLDMRAGSRCILGQLFDEGPFAVATGFTRGARELGLLDFAIEDGVPVYDVVRYGFGIQDCYQNPRNAEAWAALTAEWLRRLP